MRNAHLYFPAAVCAKGERMSKQRTMKNYEELRFCDDFMFGKVMEDPELCREVLECLLQEPVGELKEVQTQREFRYTVDGKPIRLDVYNEDSRGAIFDAEMQNLNRKTVDSHQLPKRSRYYQSAIDIDYMDQGKSYKKLPECTIMFICTFDPFGEGLSMYTFRECCDEKPELRLKDGTRKIFYNCCYEGDDLPDELKKLYDYIERDSTDSDLTRKIELAVDKGRKNALWRTQYMKEWVVIQDAREEGIEEGIEQGISRRDHEKISDMLRRGKTVEEIVGFCDYPYELVKKIEEDLLIDA